MFTTSQASVGDKMQASSRQILLLLACGSVCALTASAQEHQRPPLSIETPSKKEILPRKEAPQDRKQLYHRELRKELIEKIDETIAYLSKLAGQYPRKSPQRLKFLDKILGLHFEQAVFIASEESERYDRDWNVWNEGGQKGREPQVNNRVSKAHWQRVETLANDVLKEYPQAPQADKIKFHQAIAQQYLEKKDLAARSLQDLVKQYPRSRMLDDAHFALGEYEFGRAQFNRSLFHFEKSIDRDNPDRLGWALFKMGWCYYNLGNFQAALKFWKQTIAVTQNFQNEKKALILREEVLRDIVLAFVELGQTDEAIAYFRQNKGDEFIASFLDSLARNYQKKGAKQRSLDVWNRLLATTPDSQEAFDAQVEAIALLNERGAYDQVWTRLESMHARISPQGSWATANPNQVKDATRKTAELMIYYPKVIHKKAQKSDSSKLYSEARKGYVQYLKHYPESRDQTEIWELLGDVTYAQNQYEQAGDVYLNIVKLGKDKAVIYDEKGKVTLNIHARSAKNMLDSYNKTMADELKGLLQKRPNFEKTPETLSEQARKFISSCQLFTEQYPQEKALIRNCDSFVAEIYYRTGHREEAKKALFTVAFKYADAKEGPEAVENLIPLVKDDEAFLVSTVRRLLALSAYQKGKIGAKLQGVMRGLELKTLTQETSEKKRASLYEERALKFPNDPEADKFWYNAAHDYMKSGDMARAVNAFQMIATKYPQSRAYGESLLTLGKLYDKLFEYKRASQFYSLYAQRNPTEKEAAGAGQRACDLAIVENLDRAWDICQAFATQHKTIGARQVERMIQIAFLRKDGDRVAHLVQNVYLPNFPLDPSQKIMAYHKLFQVGSDSHRVAARKIILEQGKKGVAGEALRYYAEMLFLGHDGRFEQHMALSLRSGSVENLQASIQKISASLTQLENAYGQVTATKDSYWGTVVFYRLGLANEQFAEQLAKPPAIAGVKEDELKAQLKASVDQVMEKAREFYKVGLDTARKFSVYNESVPKLVDAQLRMSHRKERFLDWVLIPDMLGQ